MSRENVEALLAHLTPEFEMVSPAEMGVEPRTYRGPEQRTFKLRLRRRGRSRLDRAVRRGDRTRATVRARGGLRRESAGGKGQGGR